MIAPTKKIADSDISCISKTLPVVDKADDRLVAGKVAVSLDISSFWLNLDIMSVMYLGRYIG